MVARRIFVGPLARSHTGGLFFVCCFCVGCAGLFAGEPAPTAACAQSPMCVHPQSGVGAGLPANTVAAATVNGGWRLASRPGPFAGEPAPTAACIQLFTPVVGAGLPANTVVAAMVNGGWRLAGRPGPFAGKPAPTGDRAGLSNVEQGRHIAAYQLGVRARTSQALMARNKRRNDLGRDAPRRRRSISRTLEI